MPMVPTPAAARYSAAGEPQTAGPDDQNLGFENLDLAFYANIFSRMCRL